MGIQGICPDGWHVPSGPASSDLQSKYIQLNPIAQLSKPELNKQLLKEWKEFDRINCHILYLWGTQ